MHSGGVELRHFWYWFSIHIEFSHSYTIDYIDYYTIYGYTCTTLTQVLIPFVEKLKEEF